MDVGGWTRLLLTVSVCVCVVSGSPLVTTPINCASGSNQALGEVNEGFDGDIELVTGITAGSSVKLVSHIFDAHLEFLELIFTPGDTSALVRTKKPLDADGSLATSGRTLYYSVMCVDSIKHNNTRTLKVNDLNDNSPVFEEKLYSVTVSEAEKLDSTVLRVQATDADSTTENNRLTYSFTPASQDFILTNSGAFILKRRLNYNIIQKYDFIVTAQDNFGLNDTTTVVINVEDFDNLNPYFSHNIYRAFIQENQTGPFRSVEPEAIAAQDGDTGINVTLSYRISEVSPEKYAGNFQMDSSSGVVTVLTAIDREELSSNMITINIKAVQTDDSLKTADAVLSVTIEDMNDNKPEFDRAEYSATLRENSPAETAVFKAIVTDADQGGFKGSLQILPESSPFSIDADGTVRVKNSSALDRETTESFTFRIEAKETDPPNNVEEVQVVVTLLDENDNSPVFTKNTYEGKVFINQTVGLLLVQVKAEDEDVDTNGQVKYSIDFGNNKGYFSIDENTGEITLAKTIPLEDNRILEFPLYITARDGGVISRSASALVNIRAPGESNPQFLQREYRGSVEEEQDPGAVILKVSFFAMPSEIPVFGVDTVADKFAISSDGELTTSVKLDYDEAPRNYAVGISISDGVRSDRAVVLVGVTDINDNSPVFSPGSVTASVPENVDLGHNVTAVSATDKDSGFNKEIRYSLRGGEGRFAVDPLSGTVSVAGALDREAEAEYQLLVVAEDQGRPARSATASLLVRLSDVNDNAPTFSQDEYRVDVSETTSGGAVVLTLSAADRDDGANGRVSYSVVEQTPPSDPDVFELDSVNGTLRLLRPLDYSEASEYRLRVRASDGGSPPLVGESWVVVTVEDVNNKPPVFSQDTYDVAVSENLAGGASILTLQVTDGDQGGFSDGFFIYDNDTFDINRRGEVSLRKDVRLDRETVDRYTLQVVAVDQVTDGLRSTAQLNITVLDYNDNTPQFPSLQERLEVPEGEYSEESPAEVFAIVPTDADLGPNGEVTVSLAAPHPLFRFREDGMLLAVGALDRESEDSYELIVTASDKGSPQRKNVTSVRVIVTDVNDNTPEFSSSTFVASVLIKDAEEGKLLLTLSATDRDAGDNALVTYSFSAGSSPYLALDGKTGAVTLTSDLAEIKQDTTLQLTAMATDHGEPPLNSTARVVVNLRLVSLVEGVAFGSSSYNFSLAENEPAEAAVGTVWASTGNDVYSVSYELKTHTDLFSISAAGAIRTRTPLDREEREWYILDVEAVDTRTPPMTAVTMVRVQVEDVNEAPQFPSEVYKASVFSIAPYKTSVAHVKASDPDVGEEGQLVYSLTAGGPYFDVDPSSGLVFVVSAAGLTGQQVVQVKASDPRGLQATATVEVDVQGSASSADVVVISLNQPANSVEKKIPELEKSFGDVLGWTVDIIQVSSASGGEESRTAARAAARTLVSFVSVDGGKVVPAEEVTRKLQSQSAAVTAELVKVFGDGLHFDVEVGPQSSASNQAAVIALAVLLALSMLGLIAAVAFIIVRVKRTEKEKDSDKESFNIGQNYGDLRNSSQSISVTSKQDETRSEVAQQQTMDNEKKKSERLSVNADGKRDNSVKAGQTDTDDGSVTSTL